MVPSKVLLSSLISEVLLEIYQRLEADDDFYSQVLGSYPENQVSIVIERYCRRVICYVLDNSSSFVPFFEGDHTICVQLEGHYSIPVPCTAEVWSLLLELVEIINHYMSIRLSKLGSAQQRRYVHALVAWAGSPVFRTLPCSEDEVIEFMTEQSVHNYREVCNLVGIDLTNLHHVQVTLSRNVERTFAARFPTSWTCTRAEVSDDILARLALLQDEEILRVPLGKLKVIPSLDSELYLPQGFTSHWN